MRRRLATALSISAAAALLLLTACGDDDDGGGAAPTSAAAATTTAGSGGATTTAGDATATTAGEADDTPASYPADAAAAACAADKTLSPGKLVVATGQPAFGPYVIDDKPESGQGFEANLAYAVAGAMGFAPDAVSWVRTTFDGAIQPGPKDFDFNLQQYSINPDREKVVTFSDPYYAANQAILGTADSPAATATSADDFRQLKIGVAAGTTSLTFVQDVLKPTSAPFVYNDNAAAKQAIDTKQIDAIVVDLPTGIYMRDVELEGVQVYGQFTSTDSGGEPWGMLFAKDNPLHECVNEALATLRKDGILDAITERWMTEGGDIRDIALGVTTTAADDVPAVAASTRGRRHRFERRQRQRSIAIAVYSTVIVLTLLVWLIPKTSGWESVQASFFDPEVFADIFPQLLNPFWYDVQIFLWCAPCIVVAALLLALGRSVRTPALYPVRLFCTLYIDIVRGIPTILWIPLLGFGIPALLQTREWYGGFIIWGSVALVVTYSAYVAEVFRAGIESVHESQRAAARSLGMSSGQTMRAVVLPQAVRRVVPPLMNDFVSLQKDVALISILGPVEALRAASNASARTFNFTPYVAAAALFLCVSIPLTRMTDHLLQRERRRMSGTAVR